MEAKVEVGCPKSWYKREKNVEKSHFSDFFRAPDDSPQANRGTSERKMSKNFLFLVISPSEDSKKANEVYSFPSYSDSIFFSISYSTLYLSSRS